MSFPIESAVLPARRIASLNRIVALLRNAETRVARRFLELVDAAQAVQSLEEIADLIEAGRLSQALAVADRIGPGVSTALEGAYVAAGLSAAEVLRSQTGSLMEFNSLNARAQSYLTAQRLRLVRELSDETRRAARVLIDDAFQRGLAPVEQARALQHSIGLTERQARAVANYRRLLERGSAEALERRLRDRRFDPSVRRAISGERALTRDQIDRMVERYRERYVRYRAQTIAETESRAAVHAGDEELWRQAIEEGEISADRIVNTWRTRGDARVRDSHRSMDGQSQAFGDLFVSGRGNQLRFPGDPNAPAADTVRCRCVLVREALEAQARGRADASAAA